MKKQILCYTDFSENALNAIHYAIKLYKQHACAFYILNAFKADKNASDIEALVPELGNEVYESEKKISEAGLKKVIDTLKSNSKNTKHTYKTISSFNALLYALKETIKNRSIDLLVIGTKGALEEEEYENLPTLDIMEYITACSILAVPGDYKFSRLKEIVLPVDYDEAFNETDFSEMLNVAKLHQSNINVLHIKKEHHLDVDQLNNKKLLESILKAFKHSFHTLKRMGTHKGIKSFVENKHCDLIVFLEEKSSYIGNELPRPLLKELDTHLSISVMLLTTKTNNL